MHRFLVNYCSQVILIQTLQFINSFSEVEQLGFNTRGTGFNFCSCHLIDVQSKHTQLILGLFSTLLLFMHCERLTAFIHDLFPYSDRVSLQVIGPTSDHFVKRL